MRSNRAAGALNQAPRRSALHVAAAAGDVKLCVLLMKHGADAAAPDAPMQNLPLHNAIEHGHWAAADFLSRQAGVSVNAEV